MGNVQNQGTQRETFLQSPWLKNPMHAILFLQDTYNFKELREQNNISNTYNTYHISIVLPNFSVLITEFE